MPNPNEVTVALAADNQWTCTPDPIKPQGIGANIKFVLQTAGYAFRQSNAIVVQNPEDQFPDPSVTRDSTHATLKDQNTKRGRYKYSVFLTDASGKEVEIDPTINNDERP